MNYAVLLSGGVGSRINSDIPKQYVRVNGRMMVAVALQTLYLAPQVDAVCVVADETWRQEIFEDLVSSLIAGSISKAPGMDQMKQKPVFFAGPGINRQMSIWNGLQEILRNRKSMQENDEQMSIDAEKDPEAPDTVFIHDAARPYLTQKLIDACYETLSGHDGVLPVLPMKDTVYESADGRSIDRLLDRSRIFAGQAPELFLFDKYAEANRALLPDKILSINGSTEPAILAGMDVAMIPGDEKNCKVTTDADMERFRELTGGTFS